MYPWEVAATGSDCSCGKASERIATSTSTWIGLQRAGQDRDEAPGFVAALFIEQLLALIEARTMVGGGTVSPDSAGTCAMSRSAAKILGARLRSSR